MIPIWFHWNGKEFRMTLGKGRIHLKNLAADPRISGIESAEYIDTVYESAVATSSGIAIAGSVCAIRYDSIDRSGRPG